MSRSFTVMSIRAARCSLRLAVSKPTTRTGNCIANAEREIEHREKPSRFWGQVNTHRSRLEG
jgi:hypothetical protein